MSALVIIPIVLSAVAIIVTVVIAIINIKNAHSKEDKDDAKELQEAVTEIKSVKETCFGIRDEVKGMNQNILRLAEGMAKGQADRYDNDTGRDKRIGTEHGVYPVCGVTQLEGACQERMDEGHQLCRHRYRPEEEGKAGIFGGN